MRGEGLAKALLLLFALAFCWPFLSIADSPALVWGIPSLLLYVFAGWAVLVISLALVSRRFGE